MIDIVKICLFIGIPLILYIWSRVFTDRNNVDALKMHNIIYAAIIVVLFSLVLYVPQRYIIKKMPGSGLHYLVLEDILLSFSYILIGFYFIRKIRPSLLNIFFNRVSFKEFKWFILRTFCIVLIICFFMSYLKFHANLIEPSVLKNEMWIYLLSPSFILLYSFNSIMLAPLSEELFFRGVIYSGIKPIGSTTAGFLSAAMWALVHPFSIAGYILIILFGMFLAYTYSKTKMLVVPIGIHSIVNLSIDLGSATHYYGLSW